MNITRSGDRAAYLREQKKSANAGCKKCPSCGETKSHMEYFKEGEIKKGVSGGGVSQSWAEGLFKMKSYKVDCYECYTCGCQWQSDKYEWA